MPDQRKQRPELPALALISGMLGILALAISILAMIYTEWKPLNILICTLSAYILLLAVVFLSTLLRKRMKTGDFTEVKGSVFGTLSLDFVQKLHMPVLICDESGKIVWYNAALSSNFKIKGVLYGKDLKSICNTTIEQVMTSETRKEVSFLSLGETEDPDTEVFTATGYKTASKGKTYDIVIFQNITQEKIFERRLHDEDTLLAYAMIDNLDELVQYVQELYSTAASDVETILRRHLEGVGGVVRNYGHNKFLCIFSKQHLKTFMQDRFSMLDDIRSINVGETTLPITISMGIAVLEGTLYDKERASQSALDMALQRGGDQVVLKTPEGFEYYGGKTKTVQKRTKVRARVIAGKLLSLLSEAENVLIMGHRFPDFDAFASCIAILRLARYCGADAQIVTDMSTKAIEPCLKRLENMAEYENVFVDKTEAQDMIRSGTLAVVVDVNNISFCEAPDVVNTVRDVVIIDHHRKTAEFKNKPKIVYIEPSASSASELIIEFLEQILQPGTLPKIEADFLLAGMLLDTKMFTRNTGVRTFSAAMYLRSEGANPTDAQDLFKMDLSDFVSEASFENNVSLYRSQIAIAVNEEPDNPPSTRVNAARAADRLLNVEGVLAAFAICKIGDTVCVSGRSQTQVNVQLILEKMGGGGHFDSAAAQIRDTTVDIVKVSLQAAIDEYMEENK